MVTNPMTILYQDFTNLPHISPPIYLVKLLNDQQNLLTRKARLLDEPFVCKKVIAMLTVPELSFETI